MCNFPLQQQASDRSSNWPALDSLGVHSFNLISPVIFSFLIYMDYAFNITLMDLLLDLILNIKIETKENQQYSFRNTGTEIDKVKYFS